ncbi:MAG: sulfotransferase domain-containing protein [Halioglobus sp.]|nr:sulfotransferase domain-containing protein [Halioglobus sp.]
MMAWPEADPRIKLFRYEDILDNEIEVFKDIFSFYELPRLESLVGRLFASRFSAKKQTGRTSHIRDHKANQWESHFTPRVLAHLEQKHPGLLERYGYQ